MQTVLHHIGGESTEPASGSYLDNVDPATGAVCGRIASGDERDVARAVAAARSAFPDWSKTPAERRSALLLRIADAIEAERERFALAECEDTGKPLALARSVDIPRAVANLRFFATAILHFASEFHATDHRALNYTTRRARGVAGLISPWNLPLYLLTWKVAPALACGNTAVAKPSELTPRTAEMLAKICGSILPPGVLNVVHGLGAAAGAALTSHPDVGTISFTGGTATGAEIARTTGPLFKKLALEMGGKNPNIVFADADMDDAIRTSVRAAFSNQGQICLCGSRILVEQSAYDDFVTRFVAGTRALRLGDPKDPATDQGALVSRRQMEKCLAYVELARSEGGRVRTGGARPEGLPSRCADGFFVEPAVITDLGPLCRVNQEEIFGPAVTIQPFRDERHAVETANATRYGLAASVWTRDLSRAHRMAETIAAGTVWINCWMLRDLRVPFGGAKDSGLGSEGGEEALRFYTEPKNVCLRYQELEP